MSDGTDVPAEIAAAQSDAGFMNRVMSGDPDATAKWNGLFQRAFPDVPDDPAAAQPTGGAWPAPTAPASPAGTVALAEGVPPDARSYSLPLALETELPNVASAFRGWGHQAKLTVDELADLAGEIERLVRDFSDMPESELESMGRHTTQELSQTPAGRETLQRARDAWSRLERHDPELADVLAAVGASGDMRFVELLARSHRR